MTVRWQFHDPIAGDTYTFAQNPNKMSSFEITRAFNSGSSGSRDTRVRVRSEESGPPFQFSGTLRTQAQYDAFVNWRFRTNPITVTDHFARKILFIPTGFEPEDQRDGRNPWLHKYVFKGRLIPARFLAAVNSGWLA